MSQYPCKLRTPRDGGRGGGGVEKERKSFRRLSASIALLALGLWKLPYQKFNNNNNNSLLQCCLGCGSIQDVGVFRMAEGRGFHLESRPNGKDLCRILQLVAWRGVDNWKAWECFTWCCWRVLRWAGVNAKTVPPRKWFQAYTGFPLESTAH